MIGLSEFMLVTEQIPLWNSIMRIEYEARARAYIYRRTGCEEQYIYNT